MLIKNLIEDLGDDAIASSPIPIPNVNDPVLRKVVEWCEHHRNDAAQSADDDNDNRKKTTDIDEWDQKFMQVDQEMLFEIILVSRSTAATIRLLAHTNHSAGGQLPGYQGPSRCRLQDCGQHDQGQVARGYPQDVQHHERLHTRGGGADPPGERVG